MANNAELMEARMVEERNDHTIKPKQNKKWKGDNEHLREQVDVIDQSNEVRNRTKMLDHTGTHMTEARKNSIRKAKRRRREEIVGTKPLVEANVGVALGQSVVEVKDRETKTNTTRTTQYVQQAPDNSEMQLFVDEEIPVGSQYVVEPKGFTVSESVRAMNLFPVFDYAVFEHRVSDAGIDNIEHSSAFASASSFKPQRTPFDQHAYNRMRDLKDRSSMKAMIFHNHKSRMSELGKYENLLSNQDRAAYVKQTEARPAMRDPQYPQEYLMQTPQRGGPAFVRSITGGSVAYRQGDSEIPQ